MQRNHEIAYSVSEMQLKLKNRKKILKLEKFFKQKFYGKFQKI